MRAAAFAAVGALALLSTPLVAQEGPPPAAPAGAPRPPQAPMKIFKYAATNPTTPLGDHLEQARLVAAMVLAQVKPQPRFIVDVGSFTGEYLEAMLDQFPQAKGQWTEPVTNNQVNAHRRLDRFGNRVSFVIGCPSRQIWDGCFPAGADVFISSWLTIHQNLEGIQHFHKDAFARLPKDGWIAIIDHVSDGEPWDTYFANTRKDGASRELIGKFEGPPVHHAEFKTPSLNQQLTSVRAAGFVDVQVVWKQLDTVVYMARKP